MKVGDLVKFDGSSIYRQYRNLGIIVSFDEDDDPIIFWHHPSFGGQTEPCYRSHIVMLSEC